MQDYDYAIIGAGIIGAAVARELSCRQPGCRIVVIEKEAAAARHQTGRNSGVIHAGVYYPPNSLKANFCRAGVAHTLELCQQYNIAYEQCGKLIIAADDTEISELHRLYERCKENELSPRQLNQDDISHLEPNIRGQGGFLVKESGITDYAAITACLLQVAGETSHLNTRFNAKVNAITETRDKVQIEFQQGGESNTINAGFLIACGGIYSDKLIQLQGLTSDFRMIPFKGEYYRLGKQFNQISQHLIYPVPDPTMPFLGVHLTKMIGGYTTVGPNAVLSIGREAYQGISWHPKEWWHNFSYPGLWRSLWQSKHAALHELKTSLSQHYYAKQVQRYCAHIQASDFLPYRCGIRAQAVDKQGQLINDFKFVSSPLSLHVGNAPSPAATSAMPIAKNILDRLF
jgi:L-2-hydroxyglutarate oxidase